jgi:hypothetical protein
MRLVPWKSGNGKPGNGKPGTGKYGNAVAVCALAIVIGQITGPVSGSARGLQDQDQPNAEQTAQPTPKPTQTPDSPRRPQIPPGPNVRVEITITDQNGSNTPVKKTLSVIAADRFNGAVRSKVIVALPGPEGAAVKSLRYEELPLNVDVKTEVMDNGLIRIQLSLHYETYNDSRESGAAVRSVVTGNQTMMLENGKPLVVSQSADAATDRKVTLELKATILR